MKNYLEKFSNIDLSQQEIKIYTKLYEFGALTATDFSRLIQIPRTTILHNLNKLSEKGLILSKYKNGKKLFEANDPESIIQIIDRKKEKYKENLKSIEDLEKDLPEFMFDMNLIKKHYKNSDVDVRLFEGIEGVRSAYKLILQSKVLRTYANATWVTKNITDVTLSYRKKVLNNEINLKTIFLNNSSSRKTIEYFENSNRYKYKFLPKYVNISGIDYTILDNKIAIIHGDDKPSAIIINSELLSEHAKALFDLMWDLLPEANYSDLS